MFKTRDIITSLAVFLIFTAIYVFFNKVEVPKSCMRVHHSIRGSSMFPVLKDGQSTRLILRSEGCDEYKLGDIIVFKIKEVEYDLVKKIYGSPGDLVTINSKTQLLINGIPVVNSRGQLYTIKQKRIKIFLNQLSADMTIPRDHYLVLSENIYTSFDSRQYGFIPKLSIRGRVENLVEAIEELESQHSLEPFE